MLSLSALLALPALLRVAYAQTNASASSTACNNSPSLCDKSYNSITYLGSHDAPFLRNEETGWSTSGNQFFDTTTQLDYGVRLLSAQVQRTNGSTGALHVCHTSCDLLDAGPLSSWLTEVRTWLDDNPNDVVTLLLVNGANADATELAAEYATAGITTDLAYVPTGDDYTTQQWPTLRTLITTGTRLINFVASLPSPNTAAAPYLLPEFNYIFENSYENSSPTAFTCTAARPATAVDDTAAAISAGMLPLLNHFLYADYAFGIQAPNESYVETTNAPGGGVGNLGDAATSCTQAYGRAPAFVLVDFSNTGPAIETVDRLNGVAEAEVVGRRAVSTGMQSAESSGGEVLRVGMMGMSGASACVVGVLVVVLLS